MNQIYNVTQLNNHTKSLIESNFNNVWVRGEVSSLNLYDSGHLYITIKDNNSELSCVAFSYKKNISFQNGSLVTIFGNLSIYTQKGRFQFIIKDIYAVGDGELWIQYNNLKKKLLKEGLFDDFNKKKVPEYPRNIGIISSMNGSAIKDIIKIIHNKNKSIHLIIRNCLTQGINAVDDIVDSIDDFILYKNVDLLIIARGGGSIEDLMCFNDEKVVRKIFSIDIPVVSGIGHQTDFTLTDLVSDVRASTPSDAANITVRSSIEILSNLNKIIELLYNKTKNKFTLKFNYYNEIKNKIPYNPIDLLKNKYKNILLTNNLIKSKILNIINAYTIVIKSSLKILNSINPDNIKRKGYSIVKLRNNVIKNINDLTVNDRIHIDLYKGSLFSIVKEKKEV